MSEELLLTGSTGFFGAFLLRELVRTGKYTVNCLIRGQDEEHCRRRLRENLSYYVAADVIGNDGVKVTRGDLSQPFLGLSGKRYDELAENTAVVYHNGALVTSFSSQPRLRETNVDSTLWLVKLVTASLAELHYVSSDSAAESIRSPYGDSKRQAEKIVLGAAGRGLPARVYRLPRLAADSRTGLPNRKDLVFRMLDIVLRCGFAPDIELVERWIPVDLAARALVDAARNPRGGTAVSLLPRKEVSLPFLLSVAGEHGFSVQVEPPDSWAARVRAVGSAQDEVVVGALGLGDHANRGGNLREEADGFEPVEAPCVDRDTLDHYFRWYRTRRAV